MRDFTKPDITIRETPIQDTWPIRFQMMGMTPHEAKCHRCDPPLEFGPATRGSCTAWADKHLRTVHGELGITEAYEVRPGGDHW